jgi:hypothetical protein
MEAMVPEPVETHPETRSDESVGRGSLGRLLIDLVVSVDHEMEVVAGIFPAAGPPAPAAPPLVSDLGGDLEASTGPELVQLVHLWSEQRRCFDEATRALAELDHGARMLTEEGRRVLSSRLHAVREARVALEDCSHRLRRAVADEVDRRTTR